MINEFEHNELLKKITETSPDGIVFVNASGQIIYANPEAERILRLTKSELTNRTYDDPLWQITDFDGKPFPVENLPFSLVKNTLQPVYDIQHAVKHLDGKSTFLSVNAAPLLDSEKKFAGIVASIKDITEIHETQLQLQSKMAEAEQLFNISTPLCLIGQNFEMLKINDSFCDLFQVNREEVSGRKCHELWQGPSCHSANCMLQLILQGNESASYEFQRESSDGSQQDFKVQAKPYRDAEGNLIGIVENLVDISREKQAIEQMETIWNVSHDLLCVADYHTATFIRINPAFTKILGYEETELLSKSFLEFIHPADVAATVSVIDEKLKKGDTVIDFTNRYRCKDGSYKDLQWISRPIIERGQTYAIARDITEQQVQKKALHQKTVEVEQMNTELQAQNEELNNLLDKIKESEETYRNLFQNAQVGLFRTRISDGKILESNEQLARMFGYENREEFVAEYYTSSNYVDPGTREKMVEKIKKDGFLQNFEARFYRKDKSIFWAKYTAKIFPDKDWIEGVAEDISERKKVEEDLKNEKEWSDKIINNAPNIIIGLLEESEIAVFNLYAEKLTGYQAVEVLGKKWIEIFIPEELRETIYKVWADIVDNKLIDHHFENEIITKSGRRRLIRWSNTILTENGEFRMIFSIGEDITERKQEQIQLQQSEAMLSASQKIAKVGGWEYDLRTKKIFWTDETYRIHDLSPEQLPEGSEEHISRSIECYLPEDQDKIMTAFNLCIQKGIPYDIEVPFVSCKGRHLWVRTSALAQFDDDQIIKIRGTLQDITERKQEQEALQESSAKNNAILSATPDLMFITDKDGIFLEYYADDKTKLAFAPEQFLGKPIRELLPQIADASYKCYENALQTGKVQIMEYSLDFPDGKQYFEARISKVNENRLLTIVRDVTEETNASLKLEQYKNHLEELVQERTSELEEKNKRLEDFNKLFVGREFRIKELREKVKELEEKLGKV